MKQITLSGLLGSHPLGALASFGLLRLASEWDTSVRLGFTREDDWVAFLQSENLQTVEELLTRLATWINSDALERTLNWSEDVRMQPETYRKLLDAALAQNDLTLTSFISALAADGAVDGQKGLIKPGAFYMVSGQQKFLRGAKDVAAIVRSDPSAMFREALLGPWSYRARTHGLGWDPNTERLYALRHRAPTAEKPSCIAGAVILAFWALPLFPALSENGKASTIGFSRDNGETFFSWPIFSTPVDLDELRSLLHAGDGTWLAKDGKLRPGIEACYRSRRFEFGQGYAVLRAAEVTHQRSH